MRRTRAASHRNCSTVRVRGDETLVTDGYMRRIPEDPITKSADTWQTVPAEADPSNPTEISFTAFPPESYPGEGMQALNLNTTAFKGTVLLTNNENCTGATNAGRVGGMSIYDITDPTDIGPLAVGKGDTNDGAPSVAAASSGKGWARA